MQDGDALPAATQCVILSIKQFNVALLCRIHSMNGIRYNLTVSLLIKVKFISFINCMLLKLTFCTGIIHWCIHSVYGNVHYI